MSTPEPLGKPPRMVMGRDGQGAAASCAPAGGAAATAASAAANSGARKARRRMAGGLLGLPARSVRGGAAARNGAPCAACPPGEAASAPPRLQGTGRNGKGCWGCPVSGGDSSAAPQAGRSAPQFQRVPGGRPVSEPPGSYRHSQSLPARQATSPSREGVQRGAGSAVAAWMARNGRIRKGKQRHMARSVRRNRYRSLNERAARAGDGPRRAGST